MSLTRATQREGCAYTVAPGWDGFALDSHEGDGGELFPTVFFEMECQGSGAAASVPAQNEPSRRLMPCSRYAFRQRDMCIQPWQFP